MKRGIILRSEGMHLPNDKVIKNIVDAEGYKYSGIWKLMDLRNWK